MFHVSRMMSLLNIQQHAAIMCYIKKLLVCFPVWEFSTVLKLQHSYIMFLRVTSFIGISLSSELQIVQKHSS